MNKGLISGLSLKEKKAVISTLSVEEKRDFLKNISDDECYKIGIDAQNQETFDLLVEHFIAKEDADTLDILANTPHNIDKIILYFLGKDDEFVILLSYLNSSNITEEIRNKIKAYLLRHCTSVIVLKGFLIAENPVIDVDYKKELLNTYINSNNNESFVELLDLCTEENNLLEINSFLQELARRDKDVALRSIILRLLCSNDEMQKLKNSINDETIEEIVELFMSLVDIEYLFILESFAKSPMLKECIMCFIANYMGSEDIEKSSKNDLHQIYDYIIYRATNKAVLFRKFNNERLSLEAIKRWVELGMDLEVAHYSSFLLNDLPGTDEEIMALDARYNELLMMRENATELDEGTPGRH